MRQAPIALYLHLFGYTLFPSQFIDIEQPTNAQRSMLSIVTAWIGGLILMEDEKIQHFHSLNPTLFDVLDRFELYQRYRSDDEHNGMVLVLRLRMFLNEEDDPRRLRLFFSGVRDLKANFQTMMYLRIRSIHHYQWEQLNYEVQDAEQNTFSFFCQNFDASLEDTRREDEV